MSVVRLALSSLKTSTFSVKDSAKTLSICTLIAQRCKYRNNFPQTGNTLRSIGHKDTAIPPAFHKSPHFPVQRHSKSNAPEKTRPSHRFAAGPVPLVPRAASLFRSITFTRTSDLSSAQISQHPGTQHTNQNSERIGVAVSGCFHLFYPPLSSSTFTQLTITQHINFQQRRIGVAIRPERQST